MGRLGPVIRMVAQRSAGHGRLFLAMAAGAVIASALMACVVVYSDAIRDLGLKYALASQPDRNNDLALVSSSQAFGGNEYAVRKTTTDTLIARQAGDIVEGVVHYGRTATFYLTPPGGSVPEADDRPRSNLQFTDDFANHVDVIAGRLPGAPQAAPPGEPPTIEVVAGTGAARTLGYDVGAAFDLHPHWRDDRAPVRIVVVGLVEPKDADEPYWFGHTDRFEVATQSWPTYAFFSDEATLTQVLNPYIDDMDGVFETYAFVDASRITSENAADIEGRIRGLNGAAQSDLTYSYLNTRLADTIANYREQLFFTRLPLFALMLQVVGIALFYLVIVATAVVDRQAGEIALMKSRGASVGQVIAVFAIEGAGICLAATVLGPLLAALTIALLGYTPPFHDLSGNALLEVHLTPLAFALAAFGALMAFAALLWPAYRAARHSMTHHRQSLSRPEEQPAFLRYYLDLVLIGIGAFLFYQLRQRGSLVSESVFGGLSADPLLLATPTLFMLMVALVFLRLFPLVLRVVLWFTRQIKGPTVDLSLTRMARAPVQHSRLILLLILTTAVGMFAAGFRATLERGYEDRAAYRAGSELRLADIREPVNLSQPDFEAAMRDIVGNRDMAAVARLNGSYNITRYDSQSVSIIAADLDALKDVAFWRDDFASPSLPSLLDRAKYEGGGFAQGAVVPPDARAIGIWTLFPLPARTATIGLRLSDAQGSSWEYRLGTNDDGQNGDAAAGERWRFYYADLSRPNSRPGQSGSSFGGNADAVVDALFGRDRGVTGDVTVDAVYITFSGQPPGSVESYITTFDDITALPAGPDTGPPDPAAGQVIEPFDDLSRYELVRGAALTGEPGAFSTGDGREGAGLRLSFIRGPGSAPITGVRRAGDPAPLPVVASRAFLDAVDKHVGDELVLFMNRQYVDVRITGEFTYFPGFDPDKDDPLLIADLEGLRLRAARLPSLGGGSYANEAWFGPGGGTFTGESLGDLGINVQQVLDRAAILAIQRSDPLVAASWEGILFLAFAAVLLLSGLGFVIYSALSARTRSLEFAILRTMGLSGRQVLGVVSFEQLFVIASGVIAGTLLGFPLSRLMIGYMGLTEHGETPLPPLLSKVSWQAIVTVYTLLGIVVSATVASLVLLYSRVAVSRALRMGDL